MILGCAFAVGSNEAALDLAMESVRGGAPPCWCERSEGTGREDM